MIVEFIFPDGFGVEYEGEVTVPLEGERVHFDGSDESVPQATLRVIRRTFVVGRRGFQKATLHVRP